MGSIGSRKRIKTIPDEPVLWADVNEIVNTLDKKGFIKNGAVQIEDIIKDRGLNIIYDESLDSSKSGYLKCINGNWVIGVNKKHNRKRQRFTMAHEFGHYILHRSEDTMFEDEVLFRDDNVTSIEYAANNFAAELLMPKDLLQQFIKKGETSLEELANKFDVSILAAKNRILSLGYNLRNG